MAATRLLSSRAAQTRPEFVPTAGLAATRGAPTGQPLAGTSNVRLNRALALLCHLQVEGS